MVLKHVAQNRNSFFRLGAGLLRSRAALHADHVAAFAAGHLHVIGLLQLLHKIGVSAGAVRPLVDGGIQLQHGGFQQAKLRPDFAPFQHAQRALHQRHSLRKLQGLPFVRRTLPCCGWSIVVAGVVVGRFIGGWLPLLLRRMMMARPRPRIADRGISRPINSRTVLLQDGAGEGATAHHEDPLVVLFEFVHQAP